jgi:hypothetical protein
MDEASTCEVTRLQQIYGSTFAVVERSLVKRQGGALHPKVPSAVRAYTVVMFLFDQMQRRVGEVGRIKCHAHIVLSKNGRSKVTSLRWDNLRHRYSVLRVQLQTPLWSNEVVARYRFDIL